MSDVSPPDLGETSSPNSGSTSNSDISPGDSIPPAQSRVERGADTISPEEDDDAWLAEARARLGRLREVGDPASQHQQDPFHQLVLSIIAMLLVTVLMLNLMTISIPLRISSCRMRT